jgi:hypothetical protein
MKVYAEYFEENGLSFRTNTILQFGDSWDLIGNIVLANPGSATPINKINENEVNKLDTFYKKFRNSDNFKLSNWHKFSSDQTMQRIEKLFNGGYLKKDKKLNGVIQLFNTFNIRNQNLEEAVKYSDNKSKQMFSIGIEKYFNEKPTYFGFSKAVLENNILRPVAENIFNNSTPKIKSLYKETFEENSFYHPTYINRAINQEHFQWYKNDILESIIK